MTTSWGLIDPIRSASCSGVKNVGSSSNGIKLAVALVLDQLLTQFVPGFDHQGEALIELPLTWRVPGMARSAVTTLATGR
jgi:hypothetical protein